MKLTVIKLPEDFTTEDGRTMDEYEENESFEGVVEFRKKGDDIVLVSVNGIPLSEEEKEEEEEAEAESEEVPAAGAAIQALMGP